MQIRLEEDELELPAGGNAIANLEMMRLEVIPDVQPGEQTEPLQPGMFDPSDSFSASGFEDGTLDNFQKTWMDRQGFGAFLSFYVRSMDTSSDGEETQPPVLQDFEVDRLFQALVPNQRGRISAYRLIDFLGLVGRPRSIYAAPEQCDSMVQVLAALRKKYSEANRWGIMRVRCCSRMPMSMLIIIIIINSVIVYVNDWIQNVYRVGNLLC